MGKTWASDLLSISHFNFSLRCCIVDSFDRCLSFGRLLGLWGGFRLLWRWVALLLLSDILFLLRLVLVTFFANLWGTVLSRLIFLLISMLGTLLWRSWVEVLVVVTLVTVLVVLALILVGIVLSILLISLIVLHHRLLVNLLHLHLRCLSNKQLRWLAVELQTLNLRLHSNWGWAQVLVWIETSKSSHFSKACDLDEGWWLRVQGAELEWTDWWLSAVLRLVIEVVLGVIVVVVMVISALMTISNLFRHWWKSHTFWKIWKRINQISFFFIIVIEWATFTEWAFALFVNVSAWLSLVIWMDSSKSSFSEIWRKWVIWLS